MDTSFEKSKDSKTEWLTPPDLLAKLGKFDLDPCSPIVRPWDTAPNHFSEIDDGLSKDWGSRSIRVWCNPPYDNTMGEWLTKCAQHGNATALIFARTETKMFFDCVWGKATAVLFIKGRLRFYHVDGSRGGSAGAPSVLVAYDDENAKILRSSGIAGHYVLLRSGSYVF